MSLVTSVRVMNTGHKVHGQLQVGSLNGVPSIATILVTLRTTTHEPPSNPSASQRVLVSGTLRSAASWV